MPDNKRSELRRQWINKLLSRQAEIRPLSGDASFRRYFRVQHAGRTYVLMDAPPPMEDTAPFLRIRQWLENAGLRVPGLYAADETHGLLLLEDFGDMTWAEFVMQGRNPEPLFDDALHQLHRLQAAESPEDLPVFNVARMQRECDLYLDWYLPYVAAFTPSEEQREAFHAALLPRLELLAALPRVPVHLDFHSRNLMVTGGRPLLGVIDFQDAVTGPVTYDLASLLYDCYQDYAETLRLQWSHCFFSALPKGLHTAFPDVKAWHRMLRLTAWQRHIKAIGIFARLAHRDGKCQFLDEIPLTRRHLLQEMHDLDIPEEEIPLLYHAPR